MYEWLCVIAIIAVFVFVFMYNRVDTETMSTPPFRIGGYTLGSYDPNLYPSEITREPFTPVHQSMRPYLYPEFNPYPVPNIIIYPHP